MAQATLAAETAARSQRKAEARLVADTRPNSVDEGEGEDIGYDPMANHTAFGSPSRPGTIPHRHEAPAQSWSKQSWANPAPAQDAEEEIDPVLATPDGLAIWEREPVEEICVVCGDMALSHRCQKCGSWLDLGDLDALFNNDGSNRAALEQAVEHYKSQPEHPERDRSLAVALLNLHRPSEAIPYLTTLVQTDPQDPAGRSLQDLRSRKTVLMVDDDAKANAVFARTLHRNGFSTVMASDAFEVAPLAREVEVDLVLLNANMAGMDGYTLANLLRSDAATQHIPIVMVTAENGLMSRMRSRFSGVDAFFTKPFDTTKLLTTLHRALAAQPGQEAGQESEEKRTVPLG
ncbi:MAG: response regulator [Bryobacteraceae bacterium]